VRHGIDTAVIACGIVGAFASVWLSVDALVVDSPGSSLDVNATVVENLYLVAAAIISGLVLASEGEWAEGKRCQRRSRCDHGQTMLEHAGSSRL
jgi:hypothetical protein